MYTTTLLKVGGNTKEKALEEYNVNTLANTVHSSFIKLGVLDKYKAKKKICQQNSTNRHLSLSLV